MHKNFWEGECLLFYVLVFLYAENLFVKKDKLAWNYPDNLIYYTTDMYRQPLTLVIFLFCRFLFMFLGDFCKLNKTPKNGTCLGKPPGGFCDVGCCCCCFTSLEVFMFPGYVSLPLALHPSFSGPWRPPPALSSTLDTFGCFTFVRLFRHSLKPYRKCYGFKRVFFTHRYFLSSTPFPHFDTTCDSDAGRNTPSRIPLCSCPHKVVPSSWHMVLNYLYCRYKTIGLPVALVSHEV